MNNFSTVHFFRNGEWVELRCDLLESPLHRYFYYEIRVTKSVPGKRLIYDFMYPRATSKCNVLRRTIWYCKLLNKLAK